MDLTKRDGETPLQYHKRLIYGKMVDKTLDDIDYAELSELVYGKPYSSDATRKMLYGSKRTLELMDTERVKQEDNPSLLSDLDTKIEELKREQTKFYDQRREYNKLLAADARDEHLYEVLADAANNLEESVGRVYSDVQYDVSRLSNSEAILVFSDWHYGLKASNIFNEFNTTICKDRVYNVTVAAAERIQQHNCNRLHVVILGDLFHGAIHTSARVASEELVCDQLMQVSEILAQSIQFLSQFVPVVDVYMTYGNHARTVQNKNDSIHRDNMERLVPWWLQERFKQYDNITTHSDTGTEFIFINTCGHEIVAAHGDNDSVKTSPKILSTLFHKKYGKNIEYILIGDKHHRESFEELGCTALLCGSLCGADDYANEKRLYSEPSQLLLITNEECGVDAEYRIKCRN